MGGGDCFQITELCGWCEGMTNWPEGGARALRGSYKQGAGIDSMGRAMRPAGGPVESLGRAGDPLTTPTHAESVGHD